MAAPSARRPDTCPLTPCRCAGVAVLGGPLYAVGGHDGWGYLNTVERWDTQTKQWSYVGNLQHQRSTCGVAALNGRWERGARMWGKVAPTSYRCDWPCVNCKLSVVVSAFSM